MDERFIRTQMLIGAGELEKIRSSAVLVFGAGGVGGFVLEAIARAGVSKIGIVDNDIISKSNINRQIYALESTVGMRKTSAASERIKDINIDAAVKEINMFVLPENIHEINFSEYDYIVDAVDTVSAKLAIIESSKNAGKPVISSMGTGNKLNPFLFEIADISKTSVCPLARVMRRELKTRGITDVKVLYSKEEPITPGEEYGQLKGGRQAPASISFVPSVAGLLIASEVIKDLSGIKENECG